MAGITQKKLKSYISIAVPFENAKGKLQCLGLAFLCRVAERKRLFCCSLEGTFSLASYQVLNTPLTFARSG